MRAAMLLAVLACAAVPAAAQQPIPRRPRPEAFPLAVTIVGSLNFGGSRAVSPDPLVAVCTAQAQCFTHSLGSGPGIGGEVQLPLIGTLGLGIAADAAFMSRTSCLSSGACSEAGRAMALRGRAQLLVRLKARAPVYFGFGAAVVRSDPPVLTIQDEPSIEIGGAITVGADFALTPKVGIRVGWTSLLLKPDDTLVPATWELEDLVHDGMITIGARIPISHR